MVGEFHFACIARKAGSLCRRDVEEHLLGIRGDHVNRAITDLNRRSIGLPSAKQEAIL